jgi:hypothetical protein
VYTPCPPLLPASPTRTVLLVETSIWISWCGAISSVTHCWMFCFVKSLNDANVGKNCRRCIKMERTSFREVCWCKWCLVCVKIESSLKQHAEFMCGVFASYFPVI